MIIPATVILDTQNVYGSTGEVLGRRYKATPAGVRSAFAALGFEVGRVVVAMARPDEGDEYKAWTEMSRQVQNLDHLVKELNRLTSAPLPTLAGNHLLGALQHASSARNRLAGSAVPHGADVRAHCNEVCRAVLDDMRPAEDCIRWCESTLRLNADPARRSMVPSEWVQTLADLLDLARRMSTCREALDRCGSYTYAAGSNSDYRDLLEAAGDPNLQILEGRFRFGRDGDSPGEKQVDTLCAIACVEATRAALEEAEDERRAVIMVSDDDDMTPALGYCAELAHGTHVSVIVAGTSILERRYARQPAAPQRPAWICLDASAWCRIAGESPTMVLAQKQQLAALALGGAAVFDVADGRAVTRLGLAGSTHLADGQQKLSAQGLRWGRRGLRAVPNLALSADPSASVLAVTGRARRAQGSRLNVFTMPLDVQGESRDATLGAPGWWRAGTELVVARVDASGRTRWRILGPDPANPQPTAESRVARVVAVNGQFVDAADGEETWRCFAPTEMGAVPGDRVIVWPYERSARRAGPGNPPQLPRGVLLSSAL